MERDNRFLNKSYLKNLFPIMFSVLGGTINALVDSIFVSHVIGKNALAAVNVSMPVYLFICTAGSLLSSGCSTLSAQSAGTNNMKKADRYYKELLLMCAILGGAVTLLGVVFCVPISELLSGGGTLSHYVFEYCLVTFCGAIFTMALYIPASYLQLDGKNKHISVMFTVLVATDILFDFVFIIIFPFGVYGAALASVVSSVIACVYGFSALQSGHSNYHFGFRLPSALKKVLNLGSPQALGNLFDTVKLLVLNSVILGFYGEDCSAVWAAVNTLCELSLIIISGTARAAYPLTAAFFSSKENSGIRILTSLAVKTGVIMSLIFTVLLTGLCIPVRMMFGLHDSMLIPCICVGVSTALYTVCSVWESCFNACGNIMISNILSLGRKLVFPVAAAFAIAFMSGSIWLFLPVSGVLTILSGLLVTYIPYRKNRSSQRPLSRYLLLDDNLEREKKVLDFSIKADVDSVCYASEQIQGFCSDNNMTHKYTIRLGLAIEELLNVLIAKSPDIASIDLRAYALDGMTGLRIRCLGDNYDPFNDTDSDEDFLMGVSMIRKMADVTSHTYTLGMNIINIIFPLE
ncbi:MAG: MATE family efflux transporter [Porcipelethomonas sp.]